MSLAAREGDMMLAALVKNVASPWVDRDRVSVRDERLRARAERVNVKAQHDL